MNKTHIISRNEIVEIFENKALPKDIAIHIASYIAHPIHEYIGGNMLYIQNKYNLKCRWPPRNSKDYIMRWRRASRRMMMQTVSKNARKHHRLDGMDIIYTVDEYENARKKDIMIMNGSDGYMGFAKPYLPVGSHSPKQNTMVWINSLGVKVYKTWTKKKMIKHYYKSIT